jgi:hypothetical protein
MPWSAKQNKVWRAIEHGWHPPSGKFGGISREKAGEMADEGIVSKAKRRRAARKAMGK